MTKENLSKKSFPSELCIQIAMFLKLWRETGDVLLFILTALAVFAIKYRKHLRAFLNPPLEKEKHFLPLARLGDKSV